jgi:hypothetical protein
VTFAIAAVVIAISLTWGCEKGAPPAGEDAVTVIPHTFIPRLERENYWEPVKLGRGEEKFLLQIHPRLRTPGEGPWTLTIRNAEGEVAARETGQVVDVATGAVTLLCEARSFPRGDWTIDLDLEEGGRSAGPTKHRFRFRVE